MIQVPKVTVVMNCLNGERYLREALDSVYAQTFSDWEIIFWDNASTDSTPDITASYDERLRYFRSESTIPLGAARRQAMSKAKGEWIAFLDSDDYWFPEKLERQLATVDAGDYVMCYAGIIEVTPEGRKIREILPANPSGPMLDSLLRQFEINMVTPLLRRSALEKYGLDFDEKVTASEEYNLFMRLAARGPICTVREALGAWRISPGSLTDRQIAKWGEERHYTLRCLEEENPGIRESYTEAFREAYARGSYYLARFQVSKGDTAEARRTMAGIAPNNVRYFLLWLSLYVPPLWKLIHSDAVKRKWLPRIWALMHGGRA